MLRMERGGGSHAPSPDVRLVRDMWVRRGGKARVHAVKFMWGLFACNELFLYVFPVFEHLSVLFCSVLLCLARLALAGTSQPATGALLLTI